MSTQSLSTEPIPNFQTLDISGWNTSSNTDFYETFSFAESFNGDLNKWDVSNGMNTVFVLGLIYEMFNLSMSNPSLSSPNFIIG